MQNKGIQLLRKCIEISIVDINDVYLNSIFKFNRLV